MSEKNFSESLKLELSRLDEFGEKVIRKSSHDFSSSGGIEVDEDT